MGKVRRVDLYPDEWLVGTATLEADERGCYVTVCCLIYSYGEPVVDDVSDLAKLCNVTPKKWRAIRETLLSKGKLRLTEDGRLTNGRCEVELAKSLNRTQNAREIGANGGKKSGETRKNRSAASSENNDLDEPDASKKSKLTNNHQPYKELTLEADASKATVKAAPLGHDPKPANPQSQDPDATFGEWWESVPRKVSKGRAEKAYRVALKQAQPEELLTGIRRYAAEVRGTDPKFMKHPATWLNDKCWLDEPAPSLFPGGHQHDPHRPHRGNRNDRPGGWAAAAIAEAQSRH